MPTVNIPGVGAVNFPDEMSSDDIVAAIKKNRMNWKTPEKAPDPTEGMSGLDLFRAGGGKAIADAGRGIGQMLGLVSRDDVAESRRLDKALMGRGSAQAGNLAYGVGMAAPAALIPGVNTIMGGAAVGAGLGLAQPSASTGETFGNMGLGGALGGVLPAATKAWQASKSMAEPLYQAGRDRIVGRALERAAGSDAGAVADRLRNAAQPMVGPQQEGWARSTMGEIVPGSLPSVSEVAGNAGVAALQRASTAGSPEVTTAMTNRATSNNEARRSALSAMAGEDGLRDFSKAQLDGVARDMYGKAFRKGVPDLSADQVQNVAQFMSRVPDSVLSRAKELAKISGTPMSDQTSLQGMHWVKMAVDDMIGGAQRAGNSTMERALVGLQKDLLAGMDNMSPAYQAARQQYAAMSKPLNEMDTVAAILNKSTPNKLTGTVQPRAFANAMQDSTAARATGFGKATLDNTLENQTMNRLGAVREDLARSEFAQNAGRGSGSDTVQKLAYSNILDQSGVPTFMRNFAPAQVAGGLLGRGADAVYGRANRELAQQLAETMMDPAKAARLIDLAMAGNKKALQELKMLGIPLDRLPQMGLLGAPSAANSLQQ